ncbi:hypothetical protein DMH04_18115 [Kibdelosporangium aridum]|uniref:SHOCT domain-containing protein n=1 Tax=Kibdelosporangium aridum TaxID=2030 RepID=A0A428ZAX8_KIBAR|nr:SHOCT domain-containing protein [Kibdelosporangium aridum]RSM85214.1 hypothetical protein DMH04_18115 [Kibdelosporangium aridum]
MHWNYGPMGFGWLDWIFVAIVILVFLGGLTAVVLTIARRTPPQHRPRAPLDVLAERFARSEIDEEEYLARRTTLRETE